MHINSCTYNKWLRYSVFAFTLALKLNSRSRLSSNRPQIGHYIMIFISTHNSVRLRSLCAFILTWTKWHRWVLHRLQAQTNTIERPNLPYKLITLFKESTLNAKWSISLWTWWNTSRKKQEKQGPSLTWPDPLPHIGWYRLQYKHPPSESGHLYCNR